jgi:hypothetical protein
MGHFLFGLYDEDLDQCPGGVTSDCDQSVNKTVNTNIGDPNHKWAHFFVNEGRIGDSIIANRNNNSDPNEFPENFWNILEVNANHIFNVGLWSTNRRTNWSHSGGVAVYGSSVRCLMDHTGGNIHFCPVCTEEITKRLFNFAGEIFSDIEYHETYSKVFVEYKHRKISQPEYPKVGLISINGYPISENKFTCYMTKWNELCSVDVTEYLSNGANILTFNQQNISNRELDLLSLQVVNSNGAPLQLFPITDLSTIGTSSYYSEYLWPLWEGILEFEFYAYLT